MYFLIENLVGIILDHSHSLDAEIFISGCKKKWKFLILGAWKKLPTSISRIKLHPSSWLLLTYFYLYRFASVLVDQFCVFFFGICKKKCSYFGQWVKVLCSKLGFLTKDTPTKIIILVDQTKISMMVDLFYLVKIFFQNDLIHFFFYMSKIFEHEWGTLRPRIDLFFMSFFFEKQNVHSSR